MKKILLSLFAVLFLINLNASDFKADQELIFKAMQDEMSRVMKDLKAEDMPKPYYAVYKVKQENSFSVNSFMGEELSEMESTGDIAVSVMMRVGNKKLDNSFFENTVLSTADEQLPSLSYDSLRRALWLITDKAYKQALDQYAKKTAYLKKKQSKQEEPDFIKAEVLSHKEDFAFKTFDKENIIKLAKMMSAQGNKKDFKRFYARINISQGPVFYLSSEGAQYIKDDSAVMVALTAEADTPDGFPLQASRRLVYKDISELPKEEELLKIAKDFSDEFQQAVNSPKAEAFIGPVILEGSAANYLFSNIFAMNAVKTKKVLSLNSDIDYNMGEFAQKKNLKIMPLDFNVTDDPEIEVFNGQKLLGSYKVDDEGVKPQKLQLVKDGKLTDLPTTRSSGKTNGHARAGFYSRGLFPQAYISNLFFLPQKTHSPEELKQKLMQACQEEKLDYCYIIRRFDGSNITAYKVDAKTGQETIVHGLEMPSISTRTLRDIAAAGDDLKVYNAYSSSTPSYSIIAPSVLLKELELKPSQTENKKPPKLKKPELE